MSGTVVVTGATGFIGGHLCARLTRDGWRVRAIVRTSGASLRDAEAFEIPDLAAPTSAPRLAEALDGADALIHLAGRAHVLRDSAAEPLAAFRTANVEATRAVVGAAVAARTPVIALMSSAAVVGDPPPQRVDADTAPRPTTPYGASKLKAEHIAREATDGTRTVLRIFRPPLVYGPRMVGNPKRLFRLVDSGMPLPFGCIRNQRSFVYVGTLIDAFVASLRPGLPPTPPLFPSDAEALSTPAFARAIARALGRGGPIVPVPLSLLRAAGRVGDALARLGPFPLRSVEVDRLVGSFVIDGGATRALLGAPVPVPLDEALATTAAWWRSRRADAGP